jgi:hypothetical protein
MTITTGTVMTVTIITVTIVHARTRTLAVLTVVAWGVAVLAYTITTASLALYSRVRISMVYI